MPKVLRILNRFNLGGPTYNAAYLTKYLSPEFETLLIGGHKSESEDSSEFILENMGLKPVVIPEMKREINPFNDLIAYRKISHYISEFKPDIVHTHASKAGTLGRIAAINNKVPIIVHTYHGHVFHSYFNNYKVKIYKSIEQNLAKRSTKIIAISDKQKEELSHIHHITKSEKIEVIPLGFDLLRFQQDQEQKRKEFRQRYQLAENEIAIGIVGRVVPIKNHELFIKSLKHVIDNSNKKVRAFIVGDGEIRKRLENLANDLRIDFCYNGQSLNNKSTLTFTSWIKEIDKVYAGLDIVALTSLNEGTPVSLIEAQAANKPIVTTNVGGIENIVLPYITALLSNNNKDDFSKKLLTLVNKDKLRNDLSKEGWNHVREKYHYSRLVSNMKDLYYSLLYK